MMLMRSSSGSMKAEEDEGGLPLYPEAPFWGSYLESFKVINPKKELLWSLWIVMPTAGVTF